MKKERTIKGIAAPAILLLLALALMAAAASCENEPKEKPPNKADLFGTWYEFERAVYEFKSDGTLVFDSSNYNYKVSGNFISASRLTDDAGTATFAISGTGDNAKLKLSKSKGKSSGIKILKNGTYTRTAKSL